jgi:hypothetical protein
LAISAANIQYLPSAGFRFTDPPQLVVPFVQGGEEEEYKTKERRERTTEGTKEGTKETVPIVTF